MLKKIKKTSRKAKESFKRVSNKAVLLALTLAGGIPAMAQNTAGDYSAGTTALSTVAEEIVFKQNGIKYE